MTSPGVPPFQHLNVFSDLEVLRISLFRFFHGGPIMEAMIG